MSSDSAKAAVFVQSSKEATANLTKVQGPILTPGATKEENMKIVTGALRSTGFQATTAGDAIDIASIMLSDRGAMDEEGDSVQTTIYVGAVANLFASGCRECIRYMVQHKLVDILVVSGGGLEHDIRRAISPECYTIDKYASEELAGAASPKSGDDVERIGNIRVKRSEEYNSVMLSLLRNIMEDQKKRKNEQLANPPADEDKVCSWSNSPSEVWDEIGGHLAGAIGQERAETSVLYWAVKNGIKIFSPNFADGDITGLVTKLQREEKLRLHVDLVQDINLLNRTALKAKKTGMIILGGGVVKHHVCNANLMRNGADLSIFINNAQEFDGSDAGARPDEAVSWGKIRMDAKCVKVYNEISVVLPLLVREAFVPVAKKVGV